MPQRPIVFLDIDRTLLPFGPDDRSQAVEDPRAWRAHSNPQLSRLRRAPSYDLVRLGGELVWASAWGHDANDVVAPILALGRLPVVDFDEVDDDAVPGGVHWKTASLVRHAAGRPFVWLDDEIRDPDQPWVEAAHRGPALLHRVSPTSGLTKDDLAVVAAWMREAAGAPVADDVPPPLRAIMDARYDYDDGKGVAFEPYAELVDQPVVYLGSDGDVAVLACDAWDALWFFAHGFGPHDVASEFEAGERYFKPEPERAVRTHIELTRAAGRLAEDRRRPVEQIIADAPAGLPDLRAWVDDRCR